MDDINEKYKEWCRIIARSKDARKFIAHFREHVSEHFERHSREGEIGLKIWLVGVLNFMHILGEMFPEITTEDKLFKLCTYHKNHEGGPEAPFDVDKFMEDYGGDIKEFHNWKSKR